ncbi:kunitz-type protease inhibitor 2-like [Drosophila subpulchrella]|uniref:kunitz-type protease inhibitor 2-like n=1 Tax=Drosophila subpulchrella TaxID=1486046 RepID=UPI0018A1B072|nr:kunitz-type protease inhibitor 2-like [Drosophila subpulchrella]
MNFKTILTALALVTLSTLTLSQRIGPITEKCGAPPSVTGICKASIPAWTFKGGQCVSFTYGGCYKTPNYFNSPEECYTSCINYTILYG